VRSMPVPRQPRPGPRDSARPPARVGRCASYGDAMTHDEYGLILRHFTDWALKKQRAVDVGLVRELIELRASYDELEPTYWPKGSVEHRGRKVVAKDWVAQDGDDLVNRWLRAVVGLFNLIESGSPRFAVIVQALMTSYVGGRSPVSKADLLDFYDAWIMPPSEAWPDEARDSLFAPSVEHAIGQVADTGILLEDEDSVTLTPAGDVFVTAWLRHLEQRDG